MTSLSSLKLADVETILVVWRQRSISQAARELGTTPSHVSKAVMRLEKQLGIALIERSTRGVSESEGGVRLRPELQGWLSRFEEIRRSAVAPKSYMTFAATSFLSAALLPRFAEISPELHWRGINLSRSMLRAYLDQNLFDVALSFDHERLPSGWSATELSPVRHGLFARPSLARRLGKGPITPEKLSTLRFLSPVHLIDGKLMAGEDHCPLPNSERQLGYEIETVGVALGIAASTDQVLFAPVITAEPWVKRRALSEIDVAGWAVKTPLFLLCDGEKVRARQHRQWLQVVNQALA